jgi:hypothetical protein
VGYISYDSIKMRCFRAARGVALTALGAVVFAPTPASTEPAPEPPPPSLAAPLGGELPANLPLVLQYDGDVINDGAGAMFAWGHTFQVRRNGVLAATTLNRDAVRVGPHHLIDFDEPLVVGDGLVASNGETEWELHVTEPVPSPTVQPSVRVFVAQFASRNLQRNRSDEPVNHQVFVEVSIERGIQFFSLVDSDSNRQSGVVEGGDPVWRDWYGDDKRGLPGVIDGSSRGVNEVDGWVEWRAPQILKCYRGPFAQRPTTPQEWDGLPEGGCGTSPLPPEVDAEGEPDSNAAGGSAGCSVSPDSAAAVTSIGWARRILFRR